MLNSSPTPGEEDQATGETIQGSELDPDPAVDRGAIRDAYGEVRDRA